jgi:hypothetical protein
MILEMVQRSRMRNSRDPCAFPQSDRIGALGPNHLVDRVQQRLPQLSMVIRFLHALILAKHLDNVKIAG